MTTYASRSQTPTGVVIDGTAVTFSSYSGDFYWGENVRASTMEYLRKGIAEEQAKRETAKQRVVKLAATNIPAVLLRHSERDEETGLVDVSFKEITYRGRNKHTGKMLLTIDGAKVDTGGYSYTEAFVVRPLDEEEMERVRETRRAMDLADRDVSRHFDTFTKVGLAYSFALDFDPGQLSGRFIVGTTRSRTSDEMRTLRAAANGGRVESNEFTVLHEVPFKFNPKTEQWESPTMSAPALNALGKDVASAMHPDLGKTIVDATGRTMVYDDGTRDRTGEGIVDSPVKLAQLVEMVTVRQQKRTAWDQALRDYSITTVVGKDE